MNSLDALRDNLVSKEVSAPGAGSAVDAHVSLAVGLNERMEAEPDIDRIVPVSKRGMMRENHANHFRYMHSVTRVFSPGEFVETVAWALRTYRGHGFTLDYWRRMLPHCMELTRSRLQPEEARFLSTLYEWILENLDALGVITTPSGETEGGQR